jgi:hypothetical protein
MKTSILVLSVVVLFGFTACGQSGKEVPVAVKSAFSQKFPDASHVKWNKENDNEWEAEFNMDGMEYSSNFTNSGTWTETEYKIKLKDIPEAVKTSLDNESAGAKIKESEVCETKEGKVFEFVFGRGENEMELQINDAGMIIRKEPSDREQEEEDED